MITITINKDTPLEVLDATKHFIDILGNILHGSKPESLSALSSETEVRNASGSTIEAGTAVTLAPITPVAQTEAEAFIPPVPPAPVAPEMADRKDLPVTPAVIPVASVEAPTNGDSALDIENFPWDKRIHSKGKSKNVDGTWRRKRGITEAQVNQVQAEFRNSDLNESAEVPVAPVAPAASNPFAGNTPITAPVVSGLAPVAPVAPTAPASVPVAPVAPTGLVGRSYSELEVLVSTLIMSEQMDATKIMEICATNGVAAIATLKDAQPEVIGSLYAQIEASV